MKLSLFAYRAREYRFKRFVPVETSTVAESTQIRNISVIIPTRDKVLLLKKCVDSVKYQATNSIHNIEILIVNNQSVDPETHTYFGELRREGIKILEYGDKFNFSKICNAAAAVANCDVLFFLNNDCELLGESVFDKIVETTESPGVGLVAPILLGDRSTIQSAGVALWIRGIVSEPFKGIQLSKVPSLNKNIAFEATAVSFAAVAVKSDIFQQLGGLDHKFRVGLNDIDFSIRCLNAGYKNIVNTGVSARHLEFGTRPKPKSIRGFWVALCESLFFLTLYGPKNSPEQYFELTVPRKKTRNKLTC